MTVTVIGAGVYRVHDGTRRWTVAVAGPPENRWVWVDGQVARIGSASGRGRRRGRRTAGDLSAPMPATVLNVLVAPGARVARGDTLIMLEAMKMELPIRASHDGVVQRVLCRQGELVQPGEPLIHLEGGEGSEGEASGGGEGSEGEASKGYEGGEGV